MLKLLTALAVTLAALPSCSTVSRVPVPVEPAACDPGPRPARPALTWTASETSVSVPADQGLLLWRYERDEDRWHERDQVCHDTRETPDALRFITVHELAMPAETAAASDSGVGAIVASMQFPGVDVVVYWEHCGFLGDMYTLDGVLHLCYETATIPALARFTAAHEMSHAIIRQLGLPVLGNEEAEADALASVSMVLMGHQSDLLAVAAGLNSLAAVEPVYWFDPHPPLAHRARDMRCMVEGEAGRDWLFQCRSAWRLALRSWVQLLGAR